MKKTVLGMVTLLSVVTLAACGNGGKKTTNDTKVDTANMPIKVKNNKKAIKGGTLNVAMVMDTQFQGMFAQEFSQDNYDAQLIEPILGPGIFYMDKDFKVKDGGPADLKIDQKDNTATVTFRDDLKWNDGQDVTADDYIFTNEVIGNKDYTGIRYGDNFTNIKGMEDYHAGKADSISGLEKVDDKTVKIHYKQVHPGMLQAGESVWAGVLPEHYLKDVPVKKMESSEQIRKKPLSFGPYQISNVVSGESVTYIPNKYYYGKKPQLDKMVWKVVSTDSIVQALKSKKYDIATGSMPTDNFSSYKDVDGYQILGRDETSYTYLGFKLGKWDKKAGKVVTDPKAKMADKSLRQAMGYAIDNDAVGKKFYNGLRSGANSPIPPVFKTIHDSKLKGYTQDVAKAKKLLDKAGYKDKDKDGYREDKNGKKLTIKFASMSGGETAQPLADYYIQQWKKVGLNVELSTGRLIDFQAFYDKLENDDPEIDIYQGAWSTGTDPSPTGLYGPNASFNYTRFASDENTKLLKAIDSKDSFDAKTRKKNFDAWQEYVHDQAYILPSLFRTEVMPISNRVKDFDWSPDVDHMTWDSVKVTSDKR